MTKFVSIIFMVVLLGGCALSPQEIDVSPRININAAQSVASKPINVTVFDQRSISLIGSRGGVYSETSSLSTNDSFTLSIQSSVELALRQMGFKITDSQEAIQLQVYIDQLSYEVPEGYVSQVDLRAVTRVVIKKGSETFTGKYSSDIQQKLITAPSNKKNVELVNQVLSDVMGRAFNDTGFRAFLTNS